MGVEKTILKTSLGKFLLAAGLVVAPFLVSFLLANHLRDFHWLQVPFHSAVEAAGGVVALVLALLLLSSHSDRGSSERMFFALGLIAMGVLDTFHAFVGPGVAFVWLHSLATFCGGALAAAAWLVDAKVERASIKAGAWVIIGLGVLTGVLSLSYPELLPAMVLNGGFTGAAFFLNFIGGILFLAAAVLLFMRSLDSSDNELLVFSVLAAFFGVAGMLFQQSSLWDFDWWLWHAVRVVAYLCSLGYVSMLYRKTQIEINQKYDLEAMVLRLQQQQQEIEEHGWVREGIARLHETQRGQQQVARLVHNGLGVIARYLDAYVGVFYLADHQTDPPTLYLEGRFAYDDRVESAERFNFGEGLVGQVAVELKPLVVRDFPQEDILISSGLGTCPPRILTLFPVIHENSLVGVIELGLQNEFSDLQTQFLNQALPSFATAIVAAQRKELLVNRLSGAQLISET